MAKLAENLFFYPDHRDHGYYPKGSGVSYKDIWFESSDGTLLHGWFVRSARKKPIGTLLHFHGNAANITDHWSFSAWGPAQGLDVFIFDYRGYGKSKGAPDVSGVIEDCRAALRLMANAEFIRTRKVIILGQSLGGAIGLAAVYKENPNFVHGFIADSTFSSFSALVASKVPFLGSSLSSVLSKNIFIGSEFDLVGKLKNLKFPKLVIHSKRDPVIPFHLGQELYCQFSDPKQFIELNVNRHLAFFLDRTPKTWKTGMNFVHEACLGELNWQRQTYREIFQESTQETNILFNIKDENAWY